MDSKKASDELKARILKAEAALAEAKKEKLKKLPKAEKAVGVPLKHPLSPTDGRHLPKKVEKEEVPPAKE